MNAMRRGLWFEEVAGGDRRSDISASLPTEIADIARLALSICRVLEVEDDEEGQVAMACAILNHMRRYGPDGGGQGGAPARAAEASRAEKLSWQAFAIACLVMSGDMEDPTDGATHFHRHTENPQWAQRATPKALIGSYVYYVMPV